MSDIRCLICGTKGGFANEVVIYLVGDGTGIAECDWCNAGARVSK